MRMIHTGLSRRVVAGIVATSLVASAIPAHAATPGAKGDLSSDQEVTFTVDGEGGKVTRTKKMPGFTQTSAQMGSTDVQNWYNGSPEWAQGILGVLFVAVLLDLFGTLMGPVRSLIFNAIRDSRLPIPVPPRP